MSMSFIEAIKQAIEIYVDKNQSKYSPTQGDKLCIGYSNNDGYCISEVDIDDFVEYIHTEIMHNVDYTYNN